MKKIISLLLTMLLVLVPAAIVGAEAEVDVTVDVEIYTMKVTVKTDIAGGLTLKIYPVENGNVTSAVPLYLGECTDPTVDGAYYKYAFDAFSVKANTQTGTYRAIINGVYTHDFKFVNKTDKVVFYNAIQSASAATIEGILADGVETGVVDFDLGNYFAFPSTPRNVKGEVNKCLTGLDLPVLGDAPSDDQIKSFEAIFKPEVARLLNVAELVMADAEGFDEAVAKLKDVLGLDLKFYGNKKLAINPADVHTRLDSLARFSFETEDVSEAFDLAVLLAMLDKSDHGSVTEALQYYDDGVINLDTDLTEDFTESQLNEVSQTMKKEASSYETASDIENGYEKAAKEIIGDDEEEEEGGKDTPSRGPSITGSTTVKDPAADANKPVVKFSDLGGVDWAYEAINYLAEEGVLAGKGDGKFYPNDTVTREEFVKIIVEAFKIYNKHATTNFDDVAEDRWSYTYVASGVHAGIIQGISDTEFNPAGTMTRQDMAVIMNRAAKLLGLDLSGNSGMFADHASIASYAKDAVGALANAGIINGMGDNSFVPLGTVTRAQAAKVAYELMNAVGGAK